MRLEGSPDGGVGTRCDSSPKARGYKTNVISCLRSCLKKGTHHIYIAQSQSRFVVQRCMSLGRAPGYRRRRRRSGRALFERASGPFLEAKDAKAFVNTQHLMLYKGWRPFRRPQDLLPPAPPEMIKKMMTKRAATQHSFLLFLTFLKSTGKAKIHKKWSSEVDFLGVLVRRLFFVHFL